EVTDEELAEVNLIKDTFHGEWNYTIAPRRRRELCAEENQPDDRSSALADQRSLRASISEARMHAEWSAMSRAFLKTGHDTGSRNLHRTL
ncbi:MAG: hypothetical protein ABI704_05460, partial [Kofleriaceae bacterium]